MPAAPEDGENEPAMQGWHAATEVAPGAIEYVPLGHEIHVEFEFAPITGE